MKAQHLIIPGLLLASLLGCQATSHLVTAFTLQTGSMRVRLTQNTPTRSTQARVGDIDHIVVGVETVDAVATQSVAGGASAELVFRTLKPCTATVSVEAFSATESIGLASATASVEPLQITDVNINLTLSDNYDNRGNINLGINVNDGPDVIVTPVPALHD